MVAHFATAVKAPTFRVEPPPSVLFSNKYGTVIPCVIDAYHYPDPNLKITWMALIGDSYVEMEDVPALRLTRDDGSLCFPPFFESQYNDNIHYNGYVCVGQTSYGSIGSREVRVRAGMSLNPIYIPFRNTFEGKLKTISYCLT